MYVWQGPPHLWPWIQTARTLISWRRLHANWFPHRPGEEDTLPPATSPSSPRTVMQWHPKDPVPPIHLGAQWKLERICTLFGVKTAFKPGRPWSKPRPAPQMRERGAWSMRSHARTATTPTLVKPRGPWKSDLANTRRQWRGEIQEMGSLSTPMSKAMQLTGMVP